MPSTRDQLLREIKTFLRVAKMTPASFGGAAAGNNKVIAKLERGGTISIDTADRIRDYIAAERKRLRKSRASACESSLSDSRASSSGQSE